MRAQYRVKVEKITQETKDSKSYILVPVDSDDGLYDYMPGQFFMLMAEITRPENLTYNKDTKQMDASGEDVRVSERKAYSVVSSPTEQGYIELLIKSESGAFAPYFLDQAQVGDVYTVDGPQGKFMKKLFENNENRIACWSSGSGIPSTMSIMRYKLDMSLDLKVAVFDSNKTMSDVIYHERLKKLVMESDDFSAIFTITRESRDMLPHSDHESIKYSSGRFWSDSNNSLSTHISSSWLDYYNTICGSSTFINGKARDESGRLAKLGNGIEDHLQEVGIPRNRIDVDQFYLQ